MKCWTEYKPIRDIIDGLFMYRQKDNECRETLKLMVRYFVWRTRCSLKIENLTVPSFKDYLYNFMRLHKKAGSLPFLIRESLWDELKPD